jgi:signal transduction histidine kinase
VRFLRLGAVLLAGALAPQPARAQPAPADTSLPALTSIAAIRALSQDDAARGYPVRVRATVTHVDELAHGTLIIHDGALGQFVMPPAAAAPVPEWAGLRRGDAIDIEGRTERGGFAPNIRPSAIRRLSRASMPRPKQIRFSAMLTGRHDCDYVEIAGVIQRAWLSSDPQVRTLFADVAYDDGVVRAAFWDYTTADLTRFIDARVRLRGNVGTLFGSTEQLRGVSLFVGRISDVAVLEPPPDPFRLPTRSIRSLYNYSPAGEVNRRIRVRGVVTAYRPGRPVEVRDFTSTARFRYVRSVLYVNDGTGGARVETEEAPSLRVGSMVEVSGFPAVTPGKPILTNAVVKVAGEGAQPAPVPLTGSGVVAPDNDAALVRMEGTLLSVLTGPAAPTLVLKVGDTVFDADLAGGAPLGALERIRPGSVVAVTGVYAYQPGPTPTFRLLLRAPSDVVLLSAAPWWTIGHTGVMLAILAMGAVGAVIWVGASGRRKRHQYQAVLNERTRVARELHDTLEQGLSGIALQIEAVAATLEASPSRAQQSLDVARQMLRYSLEETRRSVMDLRSQALETGDLGGALTDLAWRMTLGTAATAQVRVEGTPARLDVSVEHHLLRIGLEALTNALKYSGAARIEIVLRFEAASTTLIVRDNGCGMGQAAQNPSSGHFGLQGMRERVDKLGGVLSIDSAPGNGTCVSVTVPARRLPRAPAVAEVAG